MPTATPARTHAQRMAGLAPANRIRSFRAVVKRDIKEGRADPLAMLREVAPELATMHVATFLLALPGYGQVRVRRLLMRLAIAQAKTLSGLSDRQRGALVEALGGGR